MAIRSMISASAWALQAKQRYAYLHDVVYGLEGVPDTV